MKKKKRNKSPNHDLDTIVPILIYVWRKLHKIGGGPPDCLQTREFRSVVSALKYLKEGIEHPKGKQFSDRDLLGANILYDWVIHYLEGLSLLSELPERPRRVLDLCSGTGAFAFSALRHGAGEVHAVDKDEMSLKLAGEICGRYGEAISVNKRDILQKDFSVEENFDLIVLAYSLEKLFPSSEKGWVDRQNDFIKKLLESLSEEGTLLLVEDSWPASNRRILSLRESALKWGCSVQAPCIWKGNCPALANVKGQCYAQRELVKPYLIKEIQRSALFKMNSLKMSYLFLKGPRAKEMNLSSERLYRVISSPIESYGGNRFHLCGVDGAKSLGSHFSKHPKESRAFEFLRRGDLIAVDNVLEDKNRLDIIEGSKVIVKASCGRPVFNSDEKFD